MCISRHRNSGVKPSRLNIMAQGLSISRPVPSLSPCRYLSKREVVQHLHLTHTVGQAWWCHATLYLSHPWGRALGQPVRQASAMIHEGGTCQLVKKERKNAQSSKQANQYTGYVSKISPQNFCRFLNNYWQLSHKTLNIKLSNYTHAALVSFVSIHFYTRQQFQHYQQLSV